MLCLKINGETGDEIMGEDFSGKFWKVFTSKYYILYLLLIGIAGTILTFFLKRDSSAIIIIGYGFGILQLHRSIEDRAIKKTYFKGIRILSLVIAVISIASVIYDVKMFPTGLFQ